MEWKPLSRAKKYLYCYWTMATHFEKRRLGESVNLVTFAHNLYVRSVTKWMFFFECLLFCARYGLWCREAWRVSSTKPPWSWQACVPAKWYPHREGYFDSASKGKKSANNPYCYLLIDSYTSSNLDPLCMLYFEEHVYGIGHYQSIRSLNNENFTKI